MDAGKRIGFQSGIFIVLAIAIFFGVAKNFVDVYESAEVLPPNLVPNPQHEVLLAELNTLSQIPLIEKRNYLLFIPQSNRLYWDWTTNCKTAPFVAQAITGIALLDGLPDASCNAKYYGYDTYSLRAVDEVPLQANDQRGICLRAQEKQFEKVIVIDTDSEQNAMVRRIDCSVRS